MPPSQVTMTTNMPACFKAFTPLTHYFDVKPADVPAPALVVPADVGIPAEVVPANVRIPAAVVPAYVRALTDPAETLEQMKLLNVGTLRELSQTQHVVGPAPLEYKKLDQALKDT